MIVVPIGGSFFTLHQKQETPTNELTYKTANIFSNDQKDIFFFVDPPHLLKTIWNCFANLLASMGESCTYYII